MQVKYLSQAIRLCAYGLVVVATLLLSGCIKDRNGNDYTEGYIEINPTIASGRITGNNFDRGDRIGLYAGFSPSVPDPDNYANNVAYTFDGFRWTAPGGLPLPWPANATLDIRTYWPYNPNLSTGEPRAYPFTVATDQTTYEKYIINDFLWAGKDGGHNGEAITLLFTHSMARARINITSSFDLGSDWAQRAEVAILGLLRETTIDLNNGTPNWESTFGSKSVSGDQVFKGLAIVGNVPVPREEDDLLPLVLDTPATGYDISVAAIIRPQGFEAGAPLVRIALDGEEYLFVPATTFDFKPGQSLDINLTLVERPPGLILDLNDIDWTQSRVWNVYDGNVIVAQVCREYLQGSSQSDVQAVVVYPVSGTSIDFSTGYAARIYLRSKNETGSYDIDNAYVHGGSVNFSDATLYTAGVLPPVRKVAVDPASGITGTYDAALANLTVKPVTVTDYDGNVYPIVKINQWYWTASNLRTQHFMSGNTFTAWPYGGNEANVAAYGLLYSGYTATEPQRLLPDPWHVPLVTEFDQLFTYLQPQNGSKIKANSLWQSLDKSDDVSGFSLFPGGIRSNSGSYSQIGVEGYLWAETTDSFEGIYYSINSEVDAITKAQVSYSSAMSLRLVLTNPSAILSP